MKNEELEMSNKKVIATSDALSHFLFFISYFLLNNKNEQSN